MPIRDDHDPRELHPTAPQVSIGRLPVTHRDLFGRDDEIAWLDQCWENGVHVATIVAWGGVGKSALVNAWLARVRDDGWRGAQKVFGWSFYSQGTDRLSSSDEFVDAALRWFGDKDPGAGSLWDKGERLAALVRKQRTLLVLDGLEPLQWGPGVEPGKLKDPALQALVKELGAQNMGLCLITSRIEVTDLEALGGDKVRACKLDHLSEEAGANLLAVRGAKGSQQELREATREYEGHALALTLLGSYLADIADGDVRRRKEIGLLEQDERQGEYARRVMVAYEKRLGKPELSILHMIGFFDRPADENEIATLRADPPVPGLTDGLTGVDRRTWKKAIAKLGRVGLLTEQDSNRLDAHPLVREHFGEQLRREQPEAWREGHRRLYEHLKAKAKPLPDTIEEMAPLYAAVVHGCLARKNQEALREVLWERIQRGDEYFSTKKLGAYSSEVAILSSFFDPPWERLAPGLSESEQAIMLNQAGLRLRALGRLPEAEGLERLSLEMSIAQEDWEGASVSASNLSELLQTRGELREALQEAGKSVSLADKSGDAFQSMARRTTLAAAQHAMGFREQAVAQFEEAERMQKEWQPKYPLLYSLWGFRYCDLLLDQGRNADVRERAAQTLEWAKVQLGLLPNALDHLSLGRAHLLAAERSAGGDLAEAASHLATSVNGLRRASGQEFISLGLLARAALHTHTRVFALARKDLDEAFSIATRCGFRLQEADAHLGYAHLCLTEGDLAMAGPHLVKARAIIEETGYHRRDEELAGLEAEARAMPPLQGAARPSLTLPASSGDPPQAAHEPVGVMLILDDTEIRELHAAALSVNLHERRGALMAGIDGGFVASLHVSASPGDQVMLDLDALNKTGALAGGARPLRTWLANAAHLTRERVEGATFARFVDRLPAAGPPREGPAARAPRPEATAPDRLLDDLRKLLPAQFETLVFKLAIPLADLSSATAPQAQRSIEVLRWAQQHEGRLARLARLLDDMIRAE